MQRVRQGAASTRKGDNMGRTIGILLVATAVIVAAIALSLFGLPVRHLPSPPPRTVGDTTYVTVTVESTPTRYLVLPVLTLAAGGVVLLVWPRPKRP